MKILCSRKPQSGMVVCITHGGEFCCARRPERRLKHAVPLRAVWPINPHTHMVFKCVCLAGSHFSLCAHIEDSWSQDGIVLNALPYGIATERSHTRRHWSCLWLEQAVSTSVSKGTIGWLVLQDCLPCCKGSVSWAFDWKSWMALYILLKYASRESIRGMCMRKRNVLHLWVHELPGWSCQ